MGQTTDAVTGGAERQRAFETGAIVRFEGVEWLVCGFGVDEDYLECGPEYRAESYDRMAVRALFPQAEFEAGGVLVHPSPRATTPTPL